MDSKWKPRFLWLKNWWRDWAKIDLVVLPIGIALAYLLKDYANGFWLNLSTELIGAYISVRFIDYLLKRTEIRHGRRRELSGNIFWFYENANRLSPYFEDWKIKELEKEIEVFDSTWNERRRLLEKDEQTEVENVRISRKKIVDLAKNYAISNQMLHKIEKEIYDYHGGSPKWWNNLEDAFREYRRTIINASDLIYPVLENAILGLTKESEMPQEKINAFRKYVDMIKHLIEIREAVEEEVRKHEKLVYRLDKNIYQESG